MVVRPSRCLARTIVLCAILSAASRLPWCAAAEPPAKPDADRTLREQSIYIPYDKLRQVFEREGRGVFLPYEKFRELWQAAQEKKVPAVTTRPPAGAVVTTIDSEATPSKDVVKVRATLKIEVLAEGWNEVPLRLADAAITEAKLDQQPARIVSAGDSGHKLLLEKTGKDAKTVELVLQYVKTITRSPGQNSVSFQAPQAPVNRWTIRIPEPGVKVTVHPTLAVTEPELPEAKPAPAAEPGKPEPGKPEPGKPEPKNPPETVLMAFVGAAPEVRIDWTAKAEGATGLEALAGVQAEQQVAVHEGVLRTRTHLAYAISRAELGQLAIEVPADQKVANVFDANVRQWSVETQKTSQIIRVQLFEPAKQSQNLVVELEKYLDEKLNAKITLPVVRALGAVRQQGIVVVQVAEGLRAEVVQAKGLLQVDAAELPPTLRGTPWNLSYRYASVPYEIELGIEKVQPRVLAESLAEIEIQPEALTIDVLAIYTVERAGVFRLELDVPAGFEVRQVQGRAAAKAEAAQVDTHRLEGSDKTRLVVSLARKAFGRVGLAVQLRKELHEPDLLTPTGKAAKLDVAIPAVPSNTVERSAGRVVVLAPESLAPIRASPRPCAACPIAKQWKAWSPSAVPEAATRVRSSPSSMPSSPDALSSPQSGASPR